MPAVEDKATLRSDLSARAGRGGSVSSDALPFSLPSRLKALNLGVWGKAPAVNIYTDSGYTPDIVYW